jgi:hypothetical protein
MNAVEYIRAAVLFGTFALQICFGRQCLFFRIFRLQSEHILLTDFPISPFDTRCLSRDLCPVCL